ncbi:SDR family NAD(P)-dependent oxidoreductase [Chryseobacterium indologenes]|uniref:SDR family NAD(P)-dependent oxidoreductase n=1 Tax=Chryseobacterium indologenes TaxID=253 RepID=A0AAD0YTV5_CHRID|nr:MULTISPECIES: SDR family NAD(P)-dependent oxidoreductase [Chryseobacterium]ATN06315.1 short-chain dehydrogenase/reductase [Chryseobacterium indologenes]AYY84923.1 SDR family NAD(P)-dependent oxidoreductase [Chryseobacterium indologenes]AYZ34592.1 SDR family NAD(P)-dependent oxidoreductase [Chryseobacterium indologenes]AZB18195.1 SDR family NAD(P)-dependent oxidoreductase [Chryseobacterium indologenes]MBF6643166.1 SDR family NAD(P)-dependent oxidoreductase [Chryseobacterium indologenes]
METKKVWFVTGASKGLGFELVKKLLSEGFRVAATSRSVDSLFSAFGETSENFLPLGVNITDNNDIKSAITKTVEHFGRIDVVVNNAGYGQIGTLEELTDEEARENYAVNVFGTLNVIRNAMPYLREQKSGNIFNISSVGGYSANFPGWGIYCSTKFAVAGFTEALAEEVKDFGIHATVVYPGYFRTDFLTKDSVKTPANPIQAYEAARNSEQAHLNEINGNQPNDPEKAADVLIRISKEKNPPVHLLLGVGTVEFLNNKIDILKKDAEKWESLTVSTAI